MAISLYLGLPGDGKSMSGVRKLVSVLTQGNRYVITNLPLEMGELQSYLRKEYGRDCDCMRRVVLLEQEQVRKFWLVRGEGWRMLDIEENQYAKNVFPSLQSVYRWRVASGSVRRDDLAGKLEPEVVQLVESGVVEKGDSGELALSACYIIDEAQNFWPARSFQTTPRGLLFYLSQHRHVGDDCVFITQKEGQVEKVVRNLVMEFWVFRNVGQRRRLGFRLPGVFGYSCYTEPPSSVGAIYQSVGTFRMDTEGLANCYRTADGVGVGGPTMEADTKHKKSGLSWKWAIGILMAVMFAAIWAPGLLAKVLSKFFLGSSKSLGGLVSTNLGVTKVSSSIPVQAEGQVPRDITIVVTNIIVSRPVGIARSNDVRLTSALKSESGWWITLEDGRLLGPGDYWRSIEGSSSNVLSWVELEKDGQRARWYGARHGAAPEGRGTVERRQNPH